MKKNLVYGLLALATLSISLNSCRTDEMLTGTEQAQKEKIAFFERFEKERSLSKNAESNNYALPFANSMLAYFSNYPEKKTELENKYGTVDLSVSSQNMDLENGRKLLMFPMLTDGKVTAVIGGVINEERDFLYFDVYKDNHPDRSFLIKTFQNHYSAKTVSRNDSNNPINVGYVIIIVKKPQLTKPDPFDDPGGNGGHDMGGGNGDFTDGGSGGSNPNTPNTTNPCEKMKEQNQNTEFKAKVAEIDKKEIFDKDKETGFSAAYGQPKTNYEPLSNNNDNLKFPHGNKYYGYMHAHLDSKDGIVRIFSPADIFTFLTTCVRNAETKGSMTDAYGMVITSQGNYIIKYSGNGSFGIGPGTLSSWQSWYDDKFTELNDSKGLTQDNVEKLFTQFMDEKVKIDGLEVYKSDKSTGNTTKLKYDKNTKSVVQTPC
ncbi:hypothetical protein [Chryseobacterium aurantiacum]|uniref:hypothetical protein n=1 Tax=Chryseobacterium aurantiacum TaxID=2116499 RepID=UPI0013C51C4B|nr:hypothetical protein [Chryseobacterium aurantiacum]